MTNDLLARAFIHVETGILLVFLTSVLMTQLARSSDPGHYASHASRQIRWILALFAFLGIVFGSLLSTVSPLLGVALAAGFTLALLHPVNALCFFVHMYFLRPWKVLPHNPLLLALPRMMAGACFFSWLMYRGQRATSLGPASHALKLLLGFSLWLFLSTFVTPDAGGAQVDWFNTYFKAVIIFIMSLYFIENRRSVSEFKQTIIISILGMVTLALFQFFAMPTGSTTAERLQSMPVLDPNDLAAVTVMALPLVIGPVFRGAADLGPRFAGVLFSVISVAAIWYSQSRGALIALLVQILGARYLKNLRGQWAGALLMSCFLAAGYFGINQLMQRNKAEMGASADSRIIYWKAAVHMTARHPLWGMGYGQYPANYEAYSSKGKQEWGKRTAHSTWLLAFAESGLLGGLLFIAFFVAVWLTAWRNRSQSPDHLYALLGYVVAMSFLSHTYMLYPYLLAGLILASDSVTAKVENER